MFLSFKVIKENLLLCVTIKSEFESIYLQKPHSTKEDGCSNIKKY